MKPKIIPSLIAKNQKELIKRFNRVKDLAEEFHIDVMDGFFVKKKSNLFSFKLPKNKKYQAHLQIKDPLAWIKKNWKKADLLYFHIETTNNPEKIIAFVKSKKKKVGIVLKPESPVSKIEHLLKKVHSVLILTIHPGKYGAKFLSKNLSKIKKIKQINPKMKVEIDGGVNEKTIVKVKKAGANGFIVGSFLQNTNDPKKAKKKLFKK